MKINVKGLDQLVRKLKTLPANIRKDTISDIQDAADSIVRDAGNAAPVDLGTLKQSIWNFPRNGGLNYVIRVDAKHAPYIEFGTGTEVEVPTELTAYAEQFRGEGKKDINLPARPFFFPAYIKQRSELIKNLKDTIKSNLRK